MYIFIVLICLGVGIFLSKKIDDNWEKGYYDYLYQEEDNDEEETETEPEEDLQDFNDFDKK